MLIRWKKIAAALSVTALLCSQAGVASAQDHHHSHDPEKPAQLTLNDGKKWATDDNLRQGMGRIRDALTAQLPAIHSGQATPKQYRTLAQKTNNQIAFMAKNCKLDQKTDATLHLVLAEIIAGADAMMSQDSSKARGGAEKIAHALDNYGVYFDHPGWREVKSGH